MRKRYFSMVLSMIMAISLLAGCGGGTQPDPTGQANSPAASENPQTSDNGDAPQATEQSEATSGGTLVIGEYILDTQMAAKNPYLPDNTKRELLPFMYEHLMFFNQTSGVLEEELATGYEWNSDFTTLTFTMRDDAKWHDGNPVTVDDVVYSYNVMKNEPVQDRYSLWDKISSVEANGNQVVSPFDIAEVRDMVSADELELDKLGGYKEIDPKTGKERIVKQKTALFVIISDTDDSFNFIVALMYSQLFNLMCDRADNEFGGRLPVPTRIILDEFANIGMIPKFEKLIATIRSREISVCVILQAQSQLKAIYKDNADTITGNCDTTLFLGGKEKTTLDEVSKMLGKETVDMYNTSVTKGNQESHGQNFQKLGRELMSVDEIAVMDGAKCILQIRGERPFFSNKYDITKHKNYKYLADFKARNIFDVEQFLSARLKLKPADEYEVIEIDLSAEPSEIQAAVQ